MAMPLAKIGNKEEEEEEVGERLDFKLQTSQTRRPG